MLDSKTLTISDDSGFLAIVNADRYKTYIKEDWDLSELFGRFVEEMNNQNMIIWSTGCENKWTVTVTKTFSKNKALREISRTITVTKGRLYLRNYEDLTMAAQYEDEKIPAKHNNELYIEAENGIYKLTIRQFFDQNNLTSQVPHFEIVVQKDSLEKLTPINNILWYKN